MLGTEMVLPLSGVCISNVFYWTAHSDGAVSCAGNCEHLSPFLTADVSTFHVERLKCDIVGIIGKRLTVLPRASVVS